MADIWCAAAVTAVSFEPISKARVLVTTDWALIDRLCYGESDNGLYIDALCMPPVMPV